MSRLRLRGFLVWSYAGFTALFVVSSLVAVASTYWPIAGDQWRIYRDYLAEPFPTSVLLVQNGHRPVFPGLLYLADLLFFGAQNRFITAVGVLFAIAVSASLSKQAWQCSALDRDIRVLTVCLAWIPIFWLGNLRVLGHGNGSLHAYPIFACLLIGASMLHRAAREWEREGCQPTVRPLRLVGVVAVACFIATFSYSFGVVAWPALILIAVVLRLPFRAPLLLGTSAAVTLGLYLKVTPRPGPLLDASRRGLLTCLRDAATWLGAPIRQIVWGLDSQAAGKAEVGALGMAVGAAAILSVAAVLAWLLLRRRPLSALDLSCLAIAVFGVGCALLVAYVRAPYFRVYPDQTTDWRYAPWVTFFWLGALAWLGIQVWSVGARWRPARAAWIIWLGILAVLLVPTHRSYPRVFADQRLRMREASLAVGLGVRDETLIRERLLPDEEAVELVAWTLRRRGTIVPPWDTAALLGKKPPSEPPQTAARIAGFIDGSELIADRDDKALRFVGWALDLDRKTAPPLVVVLDSKGIVRGVAIFTQSRKDVDRAYGLHPDGPLGFFGYVPGFDPRVTYQVAVLTSGGTVTRSFATLTASTQVTRWRFPASRASAGRGYSRSGGEVVNSRGFDMGGIRYALSGQLIDPDRMHDRSACGVPNGMLQGSAGGPGLLAGWWSF